MSDAGWVVCSPGRHWLQPERRAHLVVGAVQGEWEYSHFVLEYDLTVRPGRRCCCHIVTWDAGRSAERSYRLMDQSILSQALVDQAAAVATDLLLSWLAAVAVDSQLTRVRTLLTEGLGALDRSTQHATE